MPKEPNPNPFMWYGMLQDIEVMQNQDQKKSHLAIPLPLRYMLEYMPAEPEGCEKGVE